VHRHLTDLGFTSELDELDHVCYRTESTNEYDLIVQQLNNSAELLVEGIVGGRLISTFKLHEPILVSLPEGKCVSVFVIELPSPKEKSFYKSGLEHAEFVVDSLDKVKTNFAHLAWDLSGSQKRVNPDIRLQFSDFSVKFHLNSLEKVIEQEKLGK
jgi:predicted metalloenzyme YecM